MTIFTFPYFKKENILMRKFLDAKKRDILFLLLDTTQSSIFWQLSLTMSRHAVNI